MRKTLIIIAVWHSLQIIGRFFMSKELIGNPIFFVIGLILGIFLIVLTIFLFKRSSKAYWIALIWFLIQSFSFNFSGFNFHVFYGYMIDIHLFGSPIGFNPVTLLMLGLTIKMKKEYFIKP